VQGNAGARTGAKLLPGDSIPISGKQTFAVFLPDMTLSRLGKDVQGKPTKNSHFLSGALDRAFWPDGEKTAQRGKIASACFFSMKA